MSAIRPSIAARVVVGVGVLAVTTFGPSVSDAPSPATPGSGVADPPPAVFVFIDPEPASAAPSKDSLP